MAFKVVTKIKSTYDILAVFHQVLQSNDPIPENKWSDIRRLVKEWDELKQYRNYQSIEYISEVRNKLIHRGYDILYNGITGEFDLLRPKNNNPGFKAERINLKNIVKNFIINVFNLEMLILNKIGNPKVSYRPSSVTTLGYDKRGVNDINFIMGHQYGNGHLSRRKPYKLIIC